MSNFKVTFWGTRGSLVQTANDKRGYGLETSCISIETEKEIFLIDCGSGVCNFDKYIYNNKLTSKKINILITHYHHDHISGLAFTNFIYDKDIEKEIFGFGDVYTTLKNYFGPPYFPVTIVDFPNINVKNLNGFETIHFKELDINTTLLNHPQMCIGYKFIAGGKTVSIILDYEYKTDTNKSSTEEFIRESDFLIIDAFSTEEDYKSGWGHNSIEDTIMLANKLGVGKCYLTHHNVDYNDKKLDELQDNITNENKNISFAKDNFSFEL